MSIVHYALNLSCCRDDGCFALEIQTVDACWSQQRLATIYVIEHAVAAVDSAVAVDTHQAQEGIVWHGQMVSSINDDAVHIKENATDGRNRRRGR